MTEREFDEAAFLAHVRDTFEAAPYMAALGVRLVRVAPGVCETVLAMRPEHTQQNGFVHAGVTAALGDHTAGGATLLEARAHAL